jgi:hypothetical protein
MITREMLEPQRTPFDIAQGVLRHTKEIPARTDGFSLAALKAMLPRLDTR